MSKTAFRALFRLSPFAPSEIYGPEPIKMFVRPITRTRIPLFRSRGVSSRHVGQTSDSSPPGLGFLKFDLVHVQNATISGHEHVLQLQQ